MRPRPSIQQFIMANWRASKSDLARFQRRFKGGQPSAAAKASVERDEVVRAFNLMVKANAKSSLNMFVWSLASRFNSVDEMNAVAALTKQHGGTTMALRLAKAAAQRNIDIDDWAYPTKALPSWKQMGKSVEASLVYGLSRQESEFDPRAGSKAGAQGLDANHAGNRQAHFAAVSHAL